MSTSKEIAAVPNCSDTVIEEAALTLFANHPLLMGIGTTPFDRVPNAPFCGKLPLMVNFQAAALAGASYYQVLVDNMPTTDSWTNYKWNGHASVLQTINVNWVGPSVGCYPVHPLDELFLWQSPALGDVLDSRALTDGPHTIMLQFLDSEGKPMPALKSEPMRIRVNNRQCVARLAPAMQKLSIASVSFHSCYEPAYS